MTDNKELHSFVAEQKFTVEVKKGFLQTFKLILSITNLLLGRYSVWMRIFLGYIVHQLD